MKLKVEKAIKGVDKEIQEVVTYERLGPKDSCSEEPTVLKIGEKWIVHSNFERDNIPNNSFIGFSFSPLVEFDRKYSAGYIQKVESIIQNPVTAIYGQVQTHWNLSQKKDTEIFISGNGLKLSAKPGLNDDYSFENIPAGTYKIQIRFPRPTQDLYRNLTTVYSEETKTFNFEYEVTLQSGDSDYYFVVTNGVNK